MRTQSRHGGGRRTESAHRHAGTTAIDAVHRVGRKLVRQALNRAADTGGFAAALWAFTVRPELAKFF